MGNYNTHWSVFAIDMDDNDDSDVRVRICGDY